MNFKEAKTKLKEGYLEKGLEFIDENEERVHLKYANIIFTLTKEDIEEYLKLENKRSEFQITPFQTGICSKDYRENLVFNASTYGFPLSFHLRKGNITFGKSSKKNIYAEIGPASKDYMNFFRFKFEISRSSLVRNAWQWEKELNKLVHGLEKENIHDIRELFQKINTIKVFNLSEKEISKAMKKSQAIIRNCIFELSYLVGIPILMLRTWDVKPKKVFGTSKLRSTNLPLSKVNFNPDLIRFYQFGISSDIPETIFLAFYQILEYFFVSASNEEVYEKLSNEIKDPRFNLSNSNVDKLVQIVSKHRKETDETRMLKNVLNKYVTETDLIDFITKYEAHLNKKIYSKPHEVFGEVIEIKLEPNHVINNVAKHIKEIRNALVHSTDRFERKTRHIPFTETTQMIEQDIPLIKYLAEKVIVGSAK